MWKPLRKTTVLAWLMLSLSACTTQVGRPIVPQLSDELRTPCEKPTPLNPSLIGKELRGAVIQNAQESTLQLTNCYNKHLGTLKAVGVAPLKDRAAPNRWAEFENLLKGKP